MKYWAVVVGCICSVSLFGQVDSTSVDGGNIVEVEVMGSRTPTAYHQSTRVVSVISNEQLRLLSVQSVNDVLDYVSGVDLRQRGPMGIQSDVSIRGGSFDQVMVLLNGINVTDPQTGHFSMNLPVDMSAVDRIEILEGSGARAFGPNAFSGAINFVTGTSSQNQVKADVNSGEHGYFNAGAGITVNTGSYRSFLTARMGTCDGYADNTDFKSGNIFYQGMLSLGKDKLDWQIGYHDKSYGAFAFYSPKYPNQYEQNRTLFSSIKYSSSGRIKLTPSVYWRRNHDRFELFRNNPASWYTNHNYHLTDVYGAAVNGSTSWLLGTTSVGGEVRGESIWSNNLGDSLSVPVEVPGEEGVLFTLFYNRVNSSLFVEHVYSNNRFSASGGLLINQNSGLDYRFRFFPGLDLGYWMSDHIKLTCGYNRSLRMPTFTDLFSNTSTTMGNRSLKPEVVDAFELSGRWNSVGIDGHLSGFYRMADQLIDWGRLASSDKYQALNISEMTTWGIQLFAALKPTDWYGDKFFIQRLSVDYLFLNQDREADSNYDSRYVMDYLKHKLVLSLAHRIVGPLSASWSVSYQERMGTYTDKADLKNNYDPFWLTDIRLNWHHNWVDVYAEASNLFDVGFQDIGNIPQPGRWIKGGVRMSIDW